MDGYQLVKKLIIISLGIAAHQYIIKSFQQIAATSSSDRSPSNVINSLEDVSIIRSVIQYLNYNITIYRYI